MTQEKGRPLEASGDFDEELDLLRLEIDRVDQKIISALAERSEIVTKIGRLKNGNGVEPLDQERWQKVLEKVVDLAQQQDLDPQSMCEIYEIIHQDSLRIEEIPYY